MDTLKEMDRFLETFNLPSLNREEIEIMNNPIIGTEIETVIKNLPKNKVLVLLIFAIVSFISFSLFLL